MGKKRRDNIRRGSSYREKSWVFAKRYFASWLCSIVYRMRCKVYKVTIKVYHRCDMYNSNDIPYVLGPAGPRRHPGELVVPHSVHTL